MRKLMWFTIGFSAASVFGAYLYGGSWLVPGAGVALFLAVAAWLLEQYGISARIPGMVCLGIAVGLSWFWGYSALYYSHAADRDGLTEEVHVEVRDYSWEGMYGTTVDGTVLLDGKEFRVRVYLREDVTVLPGDQIVGPFRFRLTTFEGKEGNTYHQGDGIFLLAYQAGEITVQEADYLSARDYPAYLRLRISSLLNESFPADVLAFAKALLLGDTTELDYETETNFKRSGIRHVVAVSGLHVSTLFGLAYFLAGKRKLPTALIGIPLLLLFAAVAGFSPSVTRACIMQILMILAMLFGKEYDPPTALSFSCLVMLAVNPWASTSVSLQLSAGCMVGILLFSGRISGWIMDEKRLGRFRLRGLTRKLLIWFVSGMSVSLGAMSLTTPLSAAYFGTVSLVGIVTNLLTLWVVTIVFCGIGCVCLLGLFWLWGAKSLASFIAWPMRYVLWTAEVLSSASLAAVYTGGVYVVLWLLFVYLLIAVSCLCRRKQPVVIVAVASITLCVALGVSWLEPLTDECRVTVLDVGQGQSILLQSEGKTFLVDCGGDYGDTAADIAAEALMSQGINRVDGMILTHYDADHSGGASFLLTRITADNLFLPAYPDESGTKDALLNYSDGSVFQVTQAVVLSYGSVKLTVIPPENAQTDNESSLCILFQTENCDILITGDRDAAGEAELMECIELPDLELLVVGHHGSKYATSEALLDATTPDTAIISVGENNRYGHPTPEVLQRLLAAGCDIYRTDQHGTVIYRG